MEYHRGAETVVGDVDWSGAARRHVDHRQGAVGHGLFTVHGVGIVRDMVARAVACVAEQAGVSPETRCEVGVELLRLLELRIAESEEREVGAVESGRCGVAAYERADVFRGHEVLARVAYASRDNGVIVVARLDG